VASVLQGVVTTVGRNKLAKAFGQIGTGIFCIAHHFKYGEGGYVVGSSPKVPKTPTESSVFESDDIIYYASDIKPLVAADFTFIEALSTIEIRCRLTPGDENMSSITNSTPKFMELGLFDADGDLIVYTTFDEQTKTSSKSLTTYLQIVF
jgi:hypothetical protein